jgi:hypothetical protein
VIVGFNDLTDGVEGSFEVDDDENDVSSVILCVEMSYKNIELAFIIYTTHCKQTIPV